MFLKRFVTIDDIFSFNMKHKIVFINSQHEVNGLKWEGFCPPRDIWQYLKICLTLRLGW